MIDLAEMIELVEGAFEQRRCIRKVLMRFPMHDLQGQMPVMIEALPADQCAVLRVRPAGTDRHPFTRPCSSQRSMRRMSGFVGSLPAAIHLW